MKKIIYSSIFLMISTFALGQSTTILPTQTQNVSSSGDNIMINSSGNLIGIQSARFNGTITSKSAVVSGNDLLRIGAGGYFNANSTALEKGMIRFRATENWASNAGGTRIDFYTTPNGTNSTTERMTIDNNGNVGIGTTNPNTNLDILKPAVNIYGTASIRSTISKNWLSFYNNSTVYSGYVGTYNDDLNNSFEIGTGAGNASGSFFLTTQSIPRLTVTPAGFIKLGDDAATPAIKMKKLTGTTAATQGGAVEVVHGIANPLKILSIRAMVNIGGSAAVPDGFNKDNNFEANIWLGAGIVNLGTPVVFIENKAGNSFNITNRPFTVLITYEE